MGVVAGLWEQNTAGPLAEIEKEKLVHGPIKAIPLCD